MPAYFMSQQGVDRVVIDKAIYTGGHDATALAWARPTTMCNSASMADS